MRAVAVLLAATLICWLASAASAETQVKAEDCSSAVSGTVIGSHIEIHCLSKEDIARVVDELVRQGVVKRAEDAGIETSVIVSLAARLKPTQKLDLAQAVVEVSHAVDVAINVAKDGSSESKDQLVNETLKRIAEKTKANDPAGATREAEEGFSLWEKQEAERRTTATATGVALLEAALKTDLLRFDAAKATERIEKITSLQHEGNPTVLFNAVRVWQDKFYIDGTDKGINFSLQVAIAIARREIALAQSTDQRGAAFNDLGLSLAQLGERERGPENLVLAIAAYFAALQEYTRERFPLDWAASQNNLGLALWRLAERQNGTEKLEQAVAAYREALKERTRERVPLQWAETQGNLAIALALIGERDHGTGKLEQAIAADRAVLQVYTRERTPFAWAQAQNNLCAALRTLGRRASGTEKLEQAVVLAARRLKNGRASGFRPNGLRRRPISAIHSRRSGSGRTVRRGSSRRSWPSVKH